MNEDRRPRFKKGQKVVVRGTGWEVEAIVEKAVEGTVNTEYVVQVGGLFSCLREDELAPAPTPLTRDH